MNPEQFTDKLIELIASVEALKAAVNQHLRVVIDDHQTELATLRKTVETLSKMMATHIERENAHSATLAELVKYLIYASTFAFAALLSGTLWLLLNPNPWLNVK